jgi:hypothetical protein
MSLTVQDLYEIRKLMVGLHLLETGQFDKQLEAIDAATRKLDDKHKSILLVADAEKLRRDADRMLYEAKVKVTAQEDELTAKVAAHTEAAAAHATEVAQFKLMRTTEEAQIKEAKRLRAADAEEAERIKAIQITETQRLAAVADSLNERNAAITAREQALIRKLEQMQALAS